jgi:7-cyano-7-deazaguanine synthase
MRKRECVVLFSGGVDSTLALSWALRERRTVHVLEIDYPARPAGEILAAKRILRRLRPAGRTRLEVPFLKLQTALVEGYLPSRNLIYHVLAQGLAEQLGADSVVAGHVRDDAEEFPDAAPAYFTAIEDLAARGRPDGKHIPIENPLPREGVEELARASPVPLAWTWSCWEQGTQPCRRCEKCERREALIQRLNPPKRTPWAARTPKASLGRKG